MMNLPLKRINTTITQTQFEALHHLSGQTSIGFAELLRRAIDRYLEAPDVTLPHQKNATRLDLTGLDGT